MYNYVYATVGAVRGADGALGLPFAQRTVNFTAKKKDVDRGGGASENKKHKAVSIAMMRAALEKCGEQEMLDFLDEVKYSGQKLDDFADTINLVRAADERTIAEMEEELAAAAAQALPVPGPQQPQAELLADLVLEDIEE